MVLRTMGSVINMSMQLLGGESQAGDVESLRPRSGNSSAHVEFLTVRESPKSTN